MAVALPHWLVPSMGFDATELVKYAAKINVVTMVGNAELAQSKEHQAVMAFLFNSYQLCLYTLPVWSSSLDYEDGLPRHFVSRNDNCLATLAMTDPRTTLAMTGG